MFVALLGLGLALATRPAWTMTEGATFGAQTVGIHSASQTVIVTFAAAATISDPQIVTQGLLHQDFDRDPADPGSCWAGTYAAGATCTVNVIFRPLRPGTRSGAILLPGSGQLVPLTGLGTGPVALFGPGGSIPLFPGGVTWTSSMAVDNSGNVYVSKFHELLRFRSGGGTPEQVAHVLGGIDQVAIDGAGRLYLLVFNSILVLPGDAVGVDIDALPGTAFAGDPNMMAHPTAMVLDADGSVYLANTGAQNIIKIPSIDGRLQTAMQYAINQPAQGLAFDTAGNLYSTQTGDQTLRMTPLENGALNFAHTSLVLSGLDNPTTIAFDAGNNLYLAQGQYSATASVLRVPNMGGGLNLGAAATITTSLLAASQIAPDNLGNVFIADGAVNHWGAYQFDLRDPQALHFTAPIGGTSAPQTEPVFNAGNAPLDIQGVGSASPFPQTGVTTCIGGLAVMPGTSCDLTAVFNPSSPGSFSGSLDIASDATNWSANPQHVPLDGTASAETPNLTIALNVPNPIYGQPLGLNIDVQSGFGSPHPGGTFGISIDGAQAVSVPVNVSTFTGYGLGVMTAGNHSADVTFTPDPNGAFAPASGHYFFNVNKAAAQFLLVTPPPFTVGAPASATISAMSNGLAQPSGTVTYQIDNLPQQTIDLAGSPASAQISLTGLSVVNGGQGSHSLSITYDGDSNYHTGFAGSAQITVLPLTPFVSINTSPSTYGGSMSANVTVAGNNGAPAPTGGITYQIDGGAFQQSSLVQSGASLGTATFQVQGLSVGTHQLSASYSGDNSYTSGNASANFTVNKANAQSQIGSVPPYPYGQTRSINVTFQTTGNQVSPTGNVTYQIDNGPILSAAINNGSAQLPLGLLSVVNGGAGSHSVSVTYSGDNNFNGGGLGGTNVTVTKASPSLNIGTNSPVTFPNHTTFTATVTGSNGAAAPGGSISYQVDGGAVQTAPIAVNPQNASQSIVTIDVGSLSGGGHNISVTYAGDNNYNSNTSGTGFSVNRASQTVTIQTPANGSQISQAASPVPLSATSSSGLSTFNWTVLSGPATVNGASLTLTGTGTVTVQATQPGNANFNSAQNTSTFTVLASATSLKLNGVPSTVPTGTTLNNTSFNVQVLNSQNQQANVNVPVTLTVTGPNNFSAQFGGATTNGTVNINVSGLAFTSTGSYLVTATSPGLTSATAAILSVSGWAQFPSEPVGVAAPAQLVTFAFSQTTAISNAVVVTGGVTQTGDYAKAPSGSNCIGSHNAGTTCVVNVIFTPAAAGLRRGAVVLYDATGKPSQVTMLRGFGVGSVIAFGGGAPVTIASVTTPNGVALDGFGNRYVGSGNNVVRIAPDGTASNALTGLGSVVSVATDGMGNLLYADAAAGLALQVPMESGVLTPADARGATGLASPSAVTTDSFSNVYIATANGQVLFAPPAGNPSTILTGLANISALTTDHNGNLYVADSIANAIYKVPFVNNAPNPAAKTTVWTCNGCTPLSLAVDASADLYVGTASSLLFVPNTGGTLNPAGQVTIDQVAGGVSAFTGLALDATGNIYATRGDLSTLTEYFRTAPQPMIFPSTTTGSVSAPQQQSVFSIGTQPVTFGNVTFSANFPDQGSSCVSGGTLPVASACTIASAFAPQSAGPAQGSIAINHNAGNAASPQTIAQSGGGVASVTTPTVSVVVAQGATNFLGELATATATISSSAPYVATGTVTFTEAIRTFLDPLTLSGEQPTIYLHFTAPVVNGQAVLTFMPHAHHFIISAEYGGDTHFTPATGTAAEHAVTHATTLLSLSASSPVPAFGSPVTLSATVSLVNANPAAPPATGSVTFVDLNSRTNPNTLTTPIQPSAGPNDTVLGVVYLDGTGHASLTVPGSFTLGNHRIWAFYTPLFTSTAGAPLSNDYSSASSRTLLNVAPTFSLAGASAPATGVCTATVIDSEFGLNASANPQSIYLKADNSGVIDITVFATLLDPSTPLSPKIAASLVDMTTHATLISGLDFPLSTTSAPLPDGQSVADMIYRNAVPGRLYRVVLSAATSSPTTAMAFSYRAQFRGVVSASVSGPHNYGADATAFSINVDDPSAESQVALTIGAAGGSATNTATMAHVQLTDANGQVVFDDTVAAGAPFSAANTGAGQWTLRVLSVDGPFTLDKNTGSDRGLYLTPATNTCASIDTVASMSFDSPSSPSVALAMAIDPSTLGTAPTGYTVTSHAFLTGTFESFTGNATVCLAAPWADAGMFSRLRLLHNENGQLVDRTSSADAGSQTICATVAQLDAFAFATVTAPTIATASNISVEATSAAGATVSYTSPATTDAIDGSGTATCTPASGGTFPLGDTTVTCAVTNSVGLAASASFVVTVADTTAPALTGTPASLSLEASSPSGAVLNYTPPTATDLVDGAVTVTCAPLSGSAFPIGQTTVTCTATDTHHNTASSSFTVTVADTIAPAVTITSPDAKVYNTGQLVTVNYSCTDAGSGIASCSGPVASGSPLNTATPGAYTFSVTALDRAGHSTTTAVAYIVAPPGRMQGSGTLAAPADDPDARQQFTFDVTALPNGAGGGTFSYWVTDPDDRPRVGSTFASSTLTSIIFADDPTITPQTAAALIDTVTMRGTGRWNGVDGYAFLATATDKGGALAPDTFTLTVFDSTGQAVYSVGGVLATGRVTSLRLPGRTSPPLILNAPPNQMAVEATSPAGAVVTFAPVSAVDAAGMPIAVTCSPASGSTFPLGRTTGVCSTTDSRNVTTTVKFTVGVVDTTAPVLINVPADITIEASRFGGAPFTYSLPTATDAADAVPTVRCSPQSGAMFRMGATTVTCTATDHSGNRATASFVVTVIDTTPPVFLATQADIVTEAQSASGRVVTYAKPRASDIEDRTVTVTCAPASGSTFPIGTTEVTCIALDDAELTATQTFNVTVRDTTAPTITLTAPRGSFARNAVVLADYSCSDTGSGIASCVGSVPNGTAINTSVAGTFTFTVTATDVAGNPFTKSVSYTVKK